MKNDQTKNHKKKKHINDPAYILGIEAITTDDLKTIELKGEVSERSSEPIYELLNKDKDKEVSRLQFFASIFGIAGAKVYVIPHAGLVYVEPRMPWINLLFEELPKVIADPALARVFWIGFKSVDVWLEDKSTGKVIQRLSWESPF